MGAILTTFPISTSLTSVGYRDTLMTYGLIFGVVGLLAAQFLKRPPAGWMVSYQPLIASPPRRDNALLFVLLSGVLFFGWGEIFSLFPSTLTDTFGAKHATTNYGFLYMVQDVGSILGGPLAALLHEQTGSWTPVFAVVIAMDVLTAVLAYFVLKPARKAYLARSRSKGNHPKSVSRFPFRCKVGDLAPRPRA